MTLHNKRKLIFDKFAGMYLYCKGIVEVKDLVRLLTECNVNCNSINIAGITNHVGNYIYIYKEDLITGAEYHNACPKYNYVEYNDTKDDIKYLL